MDDGSVFVKGKDDFLKNVLFCQQGVKKPESNHIYIAGISELDFFFLKKMPELIHR